MARWSRRFLCVFLAFSILLLIQPVVSVVDDHTRKSLVQFMSKMSLQIEPGWGWNMSSDPCAAPWKGITCSSPSQTVRKVVLEGMNISGIFDSDLLCSVQSITVLSLSDNNISGAISEGIAQCKHLTHLYLQNNRFSGNLPKSLSSLNNLKRLDISNNNLSGDLPDLARISGMVTFLAQDNHLKGSLPVFDFLNFDEFNVSNNDFSGAIPDVHGRFGEASFLGNPGLCGVPLQNLCQLAKKKSKESFRLKHFLIYSGYILIGLIIVLLVAFKLFCKSKRKEEIHKDETSGTSSDKNSSSNNRSSHTSNFSRVNTQGNRSEFSMTSMESGVAASTLVVLNNRVLNQELRFEDLMRAPAELLGRGKHGSLYKVMLGNGLILAVKRMREWKITKEKFSSRMEKMDQEKHPNIMAPVAFYCSEAEKLLVYEYQPNGSLFQLLHGNRNGQAFDWGSRLNVAATIAGALAFMHSAFVGDQIAHGNLKSTNILLGQDMELYISEYGLMLVEDQDQAYSPNARGGPSNSPFHVDIFAFGVILLELLTGKMVQNNGHDLATWVETAIREEWTVEVFDPALTSEGSSEERMVNLLQVALKCTSLSPEERPSMSQVAALVNIIKEEEERSLSNLSSSEA